MVRPLIAAYSEKTHGKGSSSPRLLKKKRTISDMDVHGFYQHPSTFSKKTSMDSGFYPLVICYRLLLKLAIGIVD